MRYIKIIFFCLLAGTVHAKELSYDELKAEIIRISKIESSNTQNTEINKLVQSFTKNELPENKSDWSIEVDTSPIDDSKIVIMSLRAESPIRAWINEVSTPTLILRFKEGKLESYFSLGVTPDTESGDTRSLTLRFDSSPAQVYKGSISSDNKAVFLKNSRELIREISASKQLTLRFTPFNSNPVTTTFNLRGFDNSANELLAAANLDLNDRALLFEDEYRNSLSKQSSYATFGISLNKNLVTIGTEGGRWKPFARDSAALDLVSSALKALNDVSTKLKFKLIVNINGSILTTKQSIDGGIPFSSKELHDLFNKAIEKSSFDKSRISEINLKDMEPTLYGKDAPEILVGKVKDTNESITIVVNLQ